MNKDEAIAKITKKMGNLCRGCEKFCDKCPMKAITDQMVEEILDEASSL